MTTEVRPRSESIETTIRRLETYCHRMERRYECSSDFAMQAVRNHHLKETAEISRWLISYRTFLRLREAAGRETGTSTATTA